MAGALALSEPISFGDADSSSDDYTYESYEMDGSRSFASDAHPAAHEQDYVSTDRNSYVDRFSRNFFREGREGRKYRLMRKLLYFISNEAPRYISTVPSTKLIR